MEQSEKAVALEQMTQTNGWKYLRDYLERKSVPEVLEIKNLDSLIKQAYLNGVCHGCQDALKYVTTTVENYKRKNPGNVINIDNLLNSTD